MGPVPSSSGRRYRLPRPMGGTCDWFAATTWKAGSTVETTPDMNQIYRSVMLHRSKAKPT